ncbi:hypothetical protein SNE34_14765, partial [Lysobacter erysipheiresistens]
ALVERSKFGLNELLACKRWLLLQALQKRSINASEGGGDVAQFAVELGQACEHLGVLASF